MRCEPDKNRPIPLGSYGTAELAKQRVEEFLGMDPLMVDLTKVLTDLIAERDKIDAAIHAIQVLNESAAASVRHRGRPFGSLNKPKPRIDVAEMASQRSA